MDGRRRWLGVLATALVLAVVLAWRWMAGPTEPAAPTPAALASIAADPPSVPSVELAQPEVVATAPGPNRSGLAPAPDQIQLCGGDWVDADAGGMIDREALAGLAHVRQTRQAILATLQRGPTELERALALWLSPPDEALVVPEPCGEACVARSRVAARFHDLDRIARSAISSTDPRVYALAFQACRAVGAHADTCRMLSAEQWARLDPGNALPWLYVLGAIDPRRDPVGLDEALHRIATSLRIESRPAIAAGTVARAAPTDDRSLLAALDLVGEAGWLQAAESVPYPALFQSCKVDPRPDANRWQTCSAIAELMAERSDAAFDGFIASAIGRTLGWPAMRTQRVVDRARGLQWLASLSTARPLADPLTMSCAEIRQQLDLVRRTASHGEAGGAGQSRSGFPEEGAARYEIRLDARREFEAQADRRGAEMGSHLAALAAADAASRAALGPD